MKLQLGYVRYIEFNKALYFNSNFLFRFIYFKQIIYLEYDIVLFCLKCSRLRRVSAANSISSSAVAHHSVSVEQESSHPHGLIDQPTRGCSWGAFAADFHRFSRENWTTSHPHAGELNFNLLQSKLFDALKGVLG